MPGIGVLAAFWRAWLRRKDIPVPFWKALLAAVLAAAAAFAGGQLRPEDDYATLRAEAARLHGDVRSFADSRESGERRLRHLSLQSSLDRKTLETLRSHLRSMAAENLRRREEAAFYRRILGGEQKPSLRVYALEEVPDFRPRWRRLLAALVMPQKEFVGEYYFEAAVAGPRGEKILRAPAEGAEPLQFKIYAEIEQPLRLAQGEEIKKIRLVVLNDKGEVAADEVLQEETPPSENGAEPLSSFSPLQ